MYPTSDTCSITRRKVPMLRHTWTIEDFSSFLRDETNSLESVKFSLDSGNNSKKWSMKIVFEGGNIQVQLVTHSQQTHAISFEIFIKMKNGQKFDEYRSKAAMQPGFSYGSTSLISYNILRNLKDQVLPNDELTVVCTIDTDGSGQIETVASDTMHYEMPTVDMWQDLESLLMDKTYADVTLIVDEEEIKAHRIVLMARSPVFAAMFTNAMIEKQESKVVIKDLDYEVVQETLRFIYTDKAPKLAEMASDLLVAADKYQLPLLKAMAEKALGETLQVENAASVLMLANRHSAHQLKKHSLSYIRQHRKQVMATESWTDLKTDPDCVFDVCVVLGDV